MTGEIRTIKVKLQQGELSHHINENKRLESQEVKYSPLTLNWPPSPPSLKHVHSLLRSKGKARSNESKKKKSKDGIGQGRRGEERRGEERREKKRKEKKRKALLIPENPKSSCST